MVEETERFQSFIQRFRQSVIEMGPRAAQLNGTVGWYAQDLALGAVVSLLDATIDWCEEAPEDAEVWIAGTANALRTRLEEGTGAVEVHGEGALLVALARIVSQQGSLLEQRARMKVSR